jgi:hypothetical protein
VVHAVFCEINVFDNFTVESSGFIFVVFHVIFEEVLALKRSIKPFEGADLHNERKCFFLRINGAEEMIGCGFDYFQRCVGVEVDEAVGAIVIWLGEILKRAEGKKYQ